MKTYWGSGGIGTRILNLSTRWRWAVSLTPRSLHPRYLLDRRLGGSQNRSGRSGEEKNSVFFLPGIEAQSFTVQDMVEWKYCILILVMLSVARNLSKMHETKILHTRQIKIKLYLCEHHAMKTHLESGGIAPRILWPRHYMEVSGQLHAPATLPQGESPLPIG
jgi:hypothetical protein